MAVAIALASPDDYPREVAYLSLLETAVLLRLGHGYSAAMDWLTGQHPEWAGGLLDEIPEALRVRMEAAADNLHQHARNATGDEFQAATVAAYEVILDAADVLRRGGA